MDKLQTETPPPQFETIYPALAGVSDPLGMAIAGLVKLKEHGLSGYIEAHGEEVDVQTYLEEVEQADKPNEEGLETNVFDLDDYRQPAEPTKEMPAKRNTGPKRRLRSWALRPVTDSPVRDRRVAILQSEGVKAVDKEMAFNALYTEFFPALVPYAQRITGSRQHAEDVVQEALMKAWQAMDRFQDYNNDHSLRAWLYRITRNTALNATRSPAHRQTISVEDEQLTYYGTTENVVSNGTPRGDPLRMVEARETFRENIELLEELLPDQRTAILLSLEGVHYDEIGRIMGRSTSGIKSLLVRARTTLGERIQALHTPTSLRVVRDLAPRDQRKIHQALPDGGEGLPKEAHFRWIPLGKAALTLFGQKEYRTVNCEPGSNLPNLDPYSVAWTIDQRLKALPSGASSISPRTTGVEFVGTGSRKGLAISLAKSYDTTMERATSINAVSEEAGVTTLRFHGLKSFVIVATVEKEYADDCLLEAFDDARPPALVFMRPHAEVV